MIEWTIYFQFSICCHVHHPPIALQHFIGCYSILDGMVRVKMMRQNWCHFCIIWELSQCVYHVGVSLIYKTKTGWHSIPQLGKSYFLVIEEVIKKYAFADKEYILIVLYDRWNC